MGYRWTREDRLKCGAVYAELKRRGLFPYTEDNIRECVCVSIEISERLWPIK
jgi:hypothetical protein